MVARSERQQASGCAYGGVGVGLVVKYELVGRSVWGVPAVAVDAAPKRNPLALL